MAFKDFVTYLVIKNKLNLNYENSLATKYQG